MNANTSESGNTYTFEILGDDDLPARPERVFVPQQLEEAVQALVPSVPVEVNTRFRTTAVRAQHARGSKKIESLEVSWETWEDEEAYGGDGWAVIVSALVAIGAELEY